MAKIWWNTKSIIRGFSPILGIFSQYEILISLECAVDSEWDGVINFVVACSVAELLFVEITKNPVFDGPPPQLNFQLFPFIKCACVVVLASDWKSAEAPLIVFVLVLKPLNLVGLNMYSCADCKALSRQWTTEILCKGVLLQGTHLLLLSPTKTCRGEQVMWITNCIAIAMCTVTG